MKQNWSYFTLEKKAEKLCAIEFSQLNQIAIEFYQIIKGKEYLDDQKKKGKKIRHRETTGECFSLLSLIQKWKESRRYIKESLIMRSDQSASFIMSCDWS